MWHVEDFVSRFAAIVLAGVVLAFVIMSSAHAQGLSDRFGSDGEASGMVILRIPFGDPAAKRLAPELGVQLGADSQAERQYRADRYEPRSGARIPSYDTEIIPTWKIQPSKRAGDQNFSG